MRQIPLTPSEAEIRELASCRELMELWDANSAEDMAAALQGVCVVKFDFMNGSPGYCGDLFIIQSDHLSEEVPAVRLKRDSNGQLVIIHGRRIE